MQPQNDGEYQKLLSDVIRKQIIILGPTITIAKARNVPGLTVADDGTVTAISGNPQEITQHLVEQFMELSGLIVKKTMEPLFASYPGLAVATQAQTTSSTINPLVGTTLSATQPASSPSSTQTVIPPLSTPTSQTPPEAQTSPQPENTSQNQNNDNT